MKKIITFTININLDKVKSYVVLLSFPAIIISTIVYNCIIHGTNLQLLIL
jgi:hypothetical protein